MSVYLSSFRLFSNRRILRVATVIPNYFTSKNEVASGAVYFSSKDPALASGSEEILPQYFDEANSTVNMLLAFHSYPVIMNTSHFVQALSSLHNLQEADQSWMANTELMPFEDFTDLCYILRALVRALDDIETLDCIKNLNRLGVPSNVQMMQILLPIVATEVKDVRMREMRLLTGAFNDMMKDRCTPMVVALKLILPIICEVHLLSKLDRYNVQQLVEVLFFSSKKPVSEKCLTIIGQFLMQNIENISVKEAMSILCSLCGVRRSIQPTYKQYRNAYDLSHLTDSLLPFLLIIIADNVNQFSYNDLELLSSKLMDSYTGEGSFFYHEEVVECHAKFLVQKDLGFEQAVWLLKKASTFNHVNVELLDYVAKEADKAPHLLEQCTAALLLAFVSSLSHANYKPDNWSVLEQLILCNASNTLMDKSELPWMKLALELCSLDCWPVQLFETLFQEEFLNKFLSRDDNLFDLLHVLALYQAINGLCPGYTGPLPPQRILDKAIEVVIKRNVEEFPLLAALKTGLGGAQYVHTAVYSKSGYFMDHVIVMRSDGYPVAINHQPDRDLQATRVYLEDLEVTQDCNIVGVVVMQPYTYSRQPYKKDSERLQGTVDLMLRSLEALGHQLVPINITMWHQLPELQSVPYLMQAIHLKSEHGCAKAN